MWRHERRLADRLIVRAIVVRGRMAESWQILPGICRLQVLEIQTWRASGGPEPASETRKVVV